MEYTTHGEQLQKCPRCGRMKRRLLALSRTDNHTMVCDRCGTEEALETMAIVPDEAKEILALASEIIESKREQEMEIEGLRKSGIKILDYPPEGWKRIENAGTEPAGYHWYSNGKSRFGGKYEHALVKDEAERADYEERKD